MRLDQEEGSGGGAGTDHTSIGFWTVPYLGLGVDLSTSRPRL